jgi:hypothetical protein
MQRVHNYNIIPLWCAHNFAMAPFLLQDLARPGVVERFVDTPEQAQLLRTFFAGQWGLDDPTDPNTAAVIAQVSPDGASALSPPVAFWLDCMLWSPWEGWQRD